jgi:uncharacterized protein (TIGR03067 family)
MVRNEVYEVLVMPAVLNQTPKRLHNLIALFVILGSGQAPVAWGEQPIPVGKSTQSVYAKIVLPMKTPVDGNPPLVESWIARKLHKRRKTEYRAVTHWIRLAEIGEEAADVWSASVDGKSWGCPVDGRVTERTEDGEVKVRLDGWAPFPTRVKGTILPAETGSRKIAVVADGRAYVALFVGPPPTAEAFSPQPVAKGTWSYKDGKPDSVTFAYGTELTAGDIDRLSGLASIVRISMGYAGVDSEYVTIDGDLLKLGRLKNLEDVHLNKDGINNDDLKFIALLPKIRTLEFNADNGYDHGPICTDRCADHLRSAKTLRSVVIHDGQFTDKFVAKITEGLPNLEELSLNSSELTDESLRLLAERCKKLKSLSIASDHFTAEGLKNLDELKYLEKRSVSSPALRKMNDPKEIVKLLGTWEYVSATHEGKLIDVGKNETVTLTEDSWTLRRNGNIVSSSTWEIDSTRSPKWLTKFTEGGKVNFLDRWVYKFDGEQFVLCKSSWMDERRPKEFISREGDKQYLIVLSRKDTKGKTE